MSDFSDVKDHGGERQIFEGGAQREAATGKGRFDLVPPYPHRRLAAHYENGAAKYAERNWEKGLPLSRFVDSAERHLNQFKAGDRTEDHLSAVLWNIYGYMDTERRIAAGELPESLRNVPWPLSVPAGT